MRRNVRWLLVAVAAAALLGKWSWAHEVAEPATEKPSLECTAPPTTETEHPNADKKTHEDQKPPAPAPLADFTKKGVAWLIAAQHNDGGWGSGSHAHQDVKDAHAVVTDPATTSFTLLALLRAGHTPVGGEYKDAVRKGLEYLVVAVEKAPADGPLITDIQGTQPQAKLGRYVDTAMTAQYLARALAALPTEDALHGRVDKALDVCLTKLQVSQKDDGSWDNGGGWAPVLQSSLSCSALELAQAAGKRVDKDVLEKARSYQKGNFDVASGRAEASSAAGVEFYAFGGSFRANASDALQARSAIREAAADGKLDFNAPATVENLKLAGVADEVKAKKFAEAEVQNAAQINRLNDEQLLQGFGNNGGEEYLSYLVTSETLLIAGEEKFHEWQTKIAGRFEKVQNNDGSWSGHHCISSPVFCTAAVVQCLATDHDREFLVSMAKRTSDESSKVVQTPNNQPAPQ